MRVRIKPVRATVTRNMELFTWKIKLISGLLAEKIIEKTLDLFLPCNFSDLPTVLIPEFISIMVTLSLITSSLFSN